MQAVFALLLISACMIIKQTRSTSEIRFATPTIIKVPTYCFVTNSIVDSHPFYLVSHATIHKPILKYSDYAYDAERGAVILLENGNKLYDQQPIGDVSAFYLGVVSAGILLLILFRLFK